MAPCSLWSTGTKQCNRLGTSEVGEKRRPALSQKGIDKIAGGKLQQVGHFFADADKPHGQVELAGDSYGDAAFGRTVKFGEDDAGDACGLGKEAGLLQAVLAGGGVHDE